MKSILIITSLLISATSMAAMPMVTKNFIVKACGRIANEGIGGHHSGKNGNGTVCRNEQVSRDQCLDVASQAKQNWNKLKQQKASGEQVSAAQVTQAKQAADDAKDSCIGTKEIFSTCLQKFRKACHKGFQIAVYKTQNSQKGQK